MDRQMDRQTDGWTDRQTDGQTDGETDRSTFIRPSVRFFYSANPISIKYTYIAFKVGAGGTKCFGGTNFQFLQLFLITKFLKFNIFK